MIFKENQKGIFVVTKMNILRIFFFAEFF